MNLTFASLLPQFSPQFFGACTAPQFHAHTPPPLGGGWVRKVRWAEFGVRRPHLTFPAPHFSGGTLNATQDDLFNGRMEYMPAGPTIATEVWIGRRLRRPDLFAGVTDPTARRERVRAAILAGDMAEAIAGKRKDAECETWAQLFARVYGEPLTGRAAT